MNENNEITDPKLLRLLRSSGTLKRKADKSDITKIKDRFQKPNQTISIIIDGVQENIEPELILTEYKCNLCGRKFNHTPRQAAAGILPACPDCNS